MLSAFKANWCSGCETGLGGIIHKNRIMQFQFPKSCCHWNHRYLHQRLLSTASCGLLWLNPGEQGENLTSRLSWAAAWLLVTRVCHVYLVDEFSPCVLWPVMIGLMVVLLTFFWMVSMALLLWGVDAFLGNGFGI